MKLEDSPENYFWCTCCQAVNTTTGIEYAGGCWRCGGQMMKRTGTFPPSYKIRECHKGEKNLIRSGKDAVGRNVFARAVAACGFSLRRIK